MCVLSELDQYRWKPLPKEDPRVERLQADRAELISYLKATLRSPNILMEIHPRIERAIRRMEARP